MINSLVLVFPINGQIVKIVSARADLTNWRLSVDSVWKHGMIFLTMLSQSKILQKSPTLWTEAVRTSDSVSARNAQ